MNSSCKSLILRFVNKSTFFSNSVAYGSKHTQDHNSERHLNSDVKMDVMRTMITVLSIMLQTLIKEQQALNLQDYSNYINEKKNEINKKQERAKKLIGELFKHTEAICQGMHVRTVCTGSYAPDCLLLEATCNFDVSLCGFEQGIDDKFDWTRRKGNTRSSGTGPSFDHTTGDMTGYFMYIEASSPRKREDNAKLYSPPLTFAGHMCLEFYYHMSGVAIGSLKVTIDEKVVFSRSGHRGNIWYKVSINVSAIVGLHWVTFEGVIGNGDSGDIAIDDFSLTAGSCAYDCSSHYFEKYQDLPTREAHAVEHFTINGSLFLAFANYGNAERYTDSFIYKFNDSTGKFFLYQTIGTIGGHDVEYFTISGEHYLAVANIENEKTARLNSVIYRWDGQRFVVFQNISTIRGSSFHFFKIEKELFLAVSSLYDTNKERINSTIYKWTNNIFEKYQEIQTEGSRASATIVMNNESYIAFSNAATPFWASASSFVYKWSGKHFVKLQTLKTDRAMDAKFFYINDHAFLAISRQTWGKLDSSSFVYKWNGSHFVLFQSIPTRGARALHSFVMCGQTFLGVADEDNTKSVLYRFSQDKFTKYQEIPTKRKPIDMKSFEYKGDTYLAIATRNTESTLYKWT